MTEDEIRAIKIDQARKRMEFSTLIGKWDYYLLRNDRNSALQFYLTTLSMIEKDYLIEAKVANIYFEQKDWGNAYKYFRWIPFEELTEEDRHRLYQSLFFNEGISDKRTELWNIPDTLSGAEERKDYYRIVETCQSGIHNCIVTIDAYKWSGTLMHALQNITKWYNTVSPDYQYRNTLIAGKFFEQKQFFASYSIAKEILQNRPDYQEVIKILAFSAYELGKYTEAKKMFEQYLQYNPKDLITIYMLWDIHFYLQDYITSNLYFNNAVVNGYTPKITIERRLAYNYYILEDYESMVKVLKYLVQEPEAIISDFIIAVHIAQQTGRYEQALEWATNGISKFPNSDMLYALRWVTNRRVGDPFVGKTDIEQAIQLNQKNPIALMEMAYIEQENGNISNMRTYANEVLANTSDGILTNEAQTLIQYADAYDASIQMNVNETINTTNTIEWTPEIIPSEDGVIHSSNVIQ